MYTEEELIALESEEDSLTDEEILLMLAALHTTLSNLEKELRLFYQQYGKDGVITYSEARKWVSSSNHTKRLVFFNQTISDIFDYDFKLLETSFRKHLQKIVKLEADFFGIDLNIDEILDTVWGKDGLNWLQRFSTRKSNYLFQLNRDLKLSILKQDSILDVLDMASKRAETMDWTMKRLIRTESNAVSSIARKKIYDSMGVKKYRFIHIDGCHCEVCADMHGVVFPVSEYVVGETANPLHPNCRDITEPVFN